MAFVKKAHHLNTNIEYIINRTKYSYISLTKLESICVLWFMYWTIKVSTAIVLIKLFVGKRTQIYDFYGTKTNLYVCALQGWLMQGFVILV